MGKPLSDIARQAWLDCPLDGDHWEATASAVRKAVLERAIERLEKLAQISPLPNERGIDASIIALQRLMEESNDPT